MAVQVSPGATEEFADQGGARFSLSAGYSGSRVAIGQPSQPPTGQDATGEDFPYIDHPRHGVLRAMVVNFDASLLPRRRPTSEVIDMVVKRHLPAAIRERAKQPGQTALALLLATHRAVVDEAFELMPKDAAGRNYNYYQYQIGAPEDGLMLYAAFVLKPPHEPTPQRRGLVSNQAVDEAFRRLCEIGGA